MLVRERLVEQLRSRWFVPVTVVSAPAGYGKTTLLTQAIAANALAPMGVDCWLACSPGMAGASSLGEALCQAVDAAPPSVGDDAADLAAAVVNAMWRRSPRPVALWLDDVHELSSGSEAARLLEAVVGSLPANGHVVLVARGAPPVRLARLEVQGRVAQLNQADLAFTDAEVAEFAALRGAPEKKVAACGGWPALAELFASPRPGAAGDYVGEEVLAPLPAPTRKALALLAHVGPVDDELARAVLGPAVDVSGLLTGLPLVSRSDEGVWRLHALWKSLLTGDVTAGEVADARRRVGAVLLRRGQVAAAVHAFVDAAAWDEFTRAIAEALGVAHPPVARDVLAEWFARLPPEVRDGPGGRLLAGVLAVEADPRRARRLLEDCASAFRALGDTAGEIACLVHLGQMAWWSEDPEALAAVAMEAFELEAAGCEEIVPLCCLARGLLFDIANDSRSMLAELDRIMRGSLNDAWWGIVSWARAIGLLELGHTAGALEAADEALAHTKSLHAPLAQTTRLQALWYQGEVAAARDALPAVVEHIAASGYRHHTALAAAQCSVVHALLGQREQAAGYLERALTVAVVAPNSPLVDTNVAVAEAAVALLDGDEAKASDVLAAHIAKHPARRGLPAAPQQRHLALFYVLVPGTRPVWEGADLGLVWAFARGLARAVVAVREGQPVPSATPPLGDSALIQAHLPPAWVAELAVAAIAEGRDDGWQLLDDTWPTTRAAVLQIARRAVQPRASAAKDALTRLAAPPDRRLELRLLGPVELRENDVPVQADEWRRRRVHSLLAYLALNPTVSRTELADDIWPDLDAHAQSRNLRVNLTYLLRVLEPGRGKRDASFFVRHSGDNLSLHPGEWLTVDLWDFDDACARAAEADRQGRPAAALEHGQRAVQLWRGEPTELASEPWAIVPLEQRRLRLAAVAIRTGELLLAQGDCDAALAMAERALTVDPWREGAHRLIVATHHAQGNDIDARSALRRYRAAIAELGIGPDEATLMVERLLEALPTATAGRPPAIPKCGRTDATAVGSGAPGVHR